MNNTGKFFQIMEIVQQYHNENMRDIKHDAEHDKTLARQIMNICAEIL